MSQRQELINIISDFSKSATGCRCRGPFDHLTLLELQSDADYWVAAATREFEAAQDAEYYNAEMAAYAYYVGVDCDMVPNQWDEIQNKLERGQLLPT